MGEILPTIYPGCKKVCYSTVYQCFVHSNNILCYFNKLRKGFKEEFLFKALENKKIRSTSFVKCFLCCEIPLIPLTFYVIPVIPIKNISLRIDFAQINRQLFIALFYHRVGTTNRVQFRTKVISKQTCPFDEYLSFLWNALFQTLSSRYILFVYFNRLS